MAKEKSSKKKSSKKEDSIPELERISKVRKSNGKRYALFQSEFKGKPTTGIYEVDEDRKPVRNFPLISMGVAKANILLDFFSDIEDFVSDNTP